MAKNRPVISVVIPTRNRPDTLRACLASMRHHRSKAIEIIVQDNFSEEETAEVIEEARKLDPRITHSRAPYPTSQRHNFELGLAATTGDYMTIIGDDDGYTLGSLDWLASHLPKNPADAVRWQLVHYAWPSLSTDGEGFVRIYASHYYGGWLNRSANEIAALTYAAENKGSWENILVYHGMISRGLYDRMRNMTEGVFFNYPLPDVYAHNLIAAFCERLLFVDNPISIYGTSGHSAGSSWARVTKAKGEEAKAGQQWIAESQADPIAARVAWQPNIRTLRYHDYQVLKLAKATGMIPDVDVDRAIWIKAIIKEIEGNPWSLGPWLTAEPKAEDDPEVFEAVRSHFAKLAAEIPSPPGSHYEPTYPDTILRTRFASKPLNDDVEGAMLVLHELIDDGRPLYSIAKQEEQPTVKRRFRSIVRNAANKVADRTPQRIRKTFRDPRMPKLIVHTARRLRFVETERGRLMAMRLIDMRKKHEAERPADK